MCTENIVKFGHVVFEIYERTDRQTNRQTNRQIPKHADRNNSHPYPAEVKRRVYINEKHHSVRDAQFEKTADQVITYRDVHELKDPTVSLNVQFIKLMM